jgi:hypothetical protein
MCANWRGGKKEFKCFNCGKNKFLKPSKASRNKRVFCDEKCHGEFVKKHGLYHEEKHPCWGGGKHIDGGGYVRVMSKKHPNAYKGGYVLEHRLIASKALGRELKQYEDVHHKDGNKTNNNPDNLVVLLHHEHQKLHKVKIYA